LGGISGAQNIIELKKLGINAVLTCAAFTNLKYKKGMAHMVIPAQDIPSYNLGKFF